MLIDCHVHTHQLSQSNRELLKELDLAGVDKIALMSYHPASFCSGAFNDKPMPPEAAIGQVMEWAHFSDRVIPFFWIDPLEEDALEQVARANFVDIAGYKVICNRFFPGDDRPMQVWDAIAKTGKPLLFHSGILYGNGPGSQYNRPAGFEALFDIPNLRFALAHVSWPWCDENLAVFGYWQNRKHHGTTSAEMFIDTTPGTPRIYRNEVFRKIFSIGYHIEDNLMFGTDSSTRYSCDHVTRILEMDKEALDNAGVTAEQRAKYYGKNFMRFLKGQ